MDIHNNLHQYFSQLASTAVIETLLIGLKNTAVKLLRGKLGMAYTWSYADEIHEDPSIETRKIFLNFSPDFVDFEGAKGKVLLDLMNNKIPFYTSLSLALINSLNADSAFQMEEDDEENTALFTVLEIHGGSRVVMVGYSRFLENLLLIKGAEVYIYDRGSRLGSERDFFHRLSSWADSFILTSTSIIGGTFDDILARCPAGLPIALIGPSTPMVPEIFNPYGIRYLGKMVPVDMESTLRVIRQGGGTRYFQSFGKRVFSLPLKDQL